MFGTPEFVAPEVVNYEPVGLPTDVWSLGVLAYIMLSGFSPFMGDNDQETLKNVAKGEWDFEEEAFNDISDEALDWIEKILVVEKDDRMTIQQALDHPWLQMITDEEARRHARRLDSTRLAKYWKQYKYVSGHTVVSIGRVAHGGALRELHQVYRGSQLYQRILFMDSRDAAPKITRRLEDVIAIEGNAARFECEVTAMTEPLIEWYKDQESWSSESSTRCSTKMELLGEEELAQRGERRTLDLKRQRIPLGERGRKLRAGRAALIGVSEKAPRLVSELEDQQCGLGFILPLTFQVLLPPHVDTKVKWMRNEEVVKEGTHLHLLEEDEEGVYTLEIEETQITDSGIYEAEVSNQFGTVATRCKVDVDDKYMDKYSNYSRPRFTQVLRDMLIVEGSAARLDCKITGIPEPEIRWFKDHKEVQDGQHYSFEYGDDNETYTLVIQEAFLEDAGTYTCQASNLVGRIACDSGVKVKTAGADSDVE
ncbi:putative titin [Apostichopus japonicus]|uniref:Putative titin n=1 Tax=Stichopus japonicus TaxID=307972 RepID=A0A2G8LL51_STIJA|nr:putative titin [Apostichopus japonicus]